MAHRPAATSWAPGETIVIRNLGLGPDGGVVTHASAAIVVEDRPARLVLFEPLGTDMRTSRIDWASGVRDGPHPQARHTTDRLTISTPGASHCVSLMFNGGGGPFICWYVDLQEPFRRVPDGIVTRDQALDIVIDPDRHWRWKDEDHLARMIELGWIGEGRARELYREGEAVIETARKAAPPFDDRWTGWRADPTWPVPTLPDNWAAVPRHAEGRGAHLTLPGGSPIAARSPSLSPPALSPWSRRLEAHLPALPPRAKAPARVPLAHGDQRRPQGHRPPPRPQPQAADGVAPCPSPRAERASAQTRGRKRSQHAGFRL